MPTSLIQNESILAIEVGAAVTRAVLFDVVEGQYRFVASGKSSTTAEVPFNDIGIGVRQAIINLQKITGSMILGRENNLIAPSQPDGTGVDAVVAAISAGPVVRTVVVGLLSDISGESARHLAESTYTKVVEALDLSDHRKPDQQLDAIVRSRPDLVILSGGTDGGATRTILKVLETVGLACYLMPLEKRPMVLYAGNSSLSGEVQELLGGHAGTLTITRNARPSIDVEDLGLSGSELASLVIELRKKQLKGVDELALWSAGNVLPSSYAQGRMVRFLSRLYGSSRGILSVNIGSAATSIAASFGNDLVLRTFPQYGLGENLSGFLQYTKIDDIDKWLSVEVPDSMLNEYLFQKSMYPGSLPASIEDMAISQAVARQAMYLAVRTAQRDFPSTGENPQGVLSPLDLIVAGGEVLTEGMTLGQGILMLLDAIQPVGVLPILLDQNNLLPLLGVAGGRNNYLPMQVIDSGAFIGLGTVISLVASANYGSQILRVKMTYSDGTDARAEVKFGDLEILPLPSGQSARLSLQPLRGADAGLGPGKSGSIMVTGGAMGVIIDARGRPLELPSEPGRRRDLIKKWIHMVGG